jgi:addiction module RelE/StbE family toxin
MDRRIVWTIGAQEERKRILNYWKVRNASNNYSKKLNSLFNEVLKLIKNNPFIGKKTKIEYVRAKIVRDYILFYMITKSEIIVLSVWDTRQQSEKSAFSKL